MISEILAEEDRYAEAADVLKSALSVGAQGIELTLADLLSEMTGSEEEAEHWYRKAVEEGIEGALNNYGCFLSMDDHRSEEAEQLLLRAMKSGDSLAGGNLGKLYLDESRFDLALPLLRKSLDSGNAGILPHLARAELELGESAAAWQHILDAMRAGYPEVDLVCALYLDKYGELHPEENVEDAFVRSLDSGPEAHFQYANWLKKQERLEESEREYRVAIEGGESNGHLNLALLLDDLGRGEEAELQLRAGTAAGDALAAASLARFLADEGKMDEVPDAIRRAAENGCSDEEVHDLWMMYNSL
ncbi:hypothetical protein [Streptomyces sp. NPDC059076]|uniref:hypothetical protein n=1 Tax=unclassified Streptomyces TaxID=2593676 RepID=UPI0036A1B00A